MSDFPPTPSKTRLRVEAVIFGFLTALFITLATLAVVDCVNWWHVGNPAKATTSALTAFGLGALVMILASNLHDAGEALQELNDAPAK